MKHIQAFVLISVLTITSRTFALTVPAVDCFKAGMSDAQVLTRTKAYDKASASAANTEASLVKLCAAAPDTNSRIDCYKAATVDPDILAFAKSQVGAYGPSGIEPMVVALCGR